MLYTIQNIEPMGNPLNISDLADDVLKSMFENKFSNEELVKIIELAGSMLNLKTISDYARENNLSYNGVKNNRDIVDLFNVKFVIDNE